MTTLHRLETRRRELLNESEAVESKLLIGVVDNSYLLSLRNSDLIGWLL